MGPISYLPATKNTHQAILRDGIPNWVQIGEDQVTCVEPQHEAAKFRENGMDNNGFPGVFAKIDGHIDVGRIPCELKAAHLPTIGGERISLLVGKPEIIYDGF